MASGRKFNARHLGSTKNYQVQEQMWFEVTIEGMDEDLVFLTQSCSLPEASNTGIEIPHGNSSAYVAGKREYSTNQFTFLDAMVFDTEAKIKAWQNQVYNDETGDMGWVDEYKRTISVVEYSPHGDIERKWMFEGCWPETVVYGNLTGDSAGKKDVQVTIRFDTAYRE